jgi:hypothetical protein
VTGAVVTGRRGRVLAEIAEGAEIAEKNRDFHAKARRRQEEGLIRAKLAKRAKME